MQVQSETERQKTAEVRIIDYEGKEEGGVIPPWVNAYLNGGNRGVEKLGAYQNRYVFIRSSEGNNFYALNRWARSFTIYQDFSPLAAERIEKRLYGGAEYYPDDEYGRFFETVMRRSYNKDYQGAEKEAAFWIRQQFLEGEAVVRENYNFLVLTVIDKKIFEEQVQESFRFINSPPKPTRAQAAAIERITSRFFDDF